VAAIANKMIPKKNYNDYLVILSQMTHGLIPVEHLDEFAAMAEKLPYQEKKTILGAIAVIRHDPAEVDKQFRAAIADSGGEHIHVINYSLALSNLGKHQNAINVIDTLLTEDPSNVEYLNEAIKVYADGYYTTGLHSLIAIHDKLNVKIKHRSKKMEMLPNIEQLMSNYGADWREISSRIEFATDLLRRKGLKIKAPSEYVDDEMIHYVFNIEADLDVVIEAENTLSDELASLPYSVADSVMSFTCRQA
jgi:tetratricopeptide (TPR) repeat protein